MSTAGRPGLEPLPTPCRFGERGRFELRVAARQLLDNGTPLALGGRAFDLLVALIERRGRVVPRGELIDAVWPGRVVEENNLSVQVNALRRALGADCLVTIPGRGYRFGALLDAATAAVPVADAPSGIAAPARTHLPAAQPLLIGRSDDLAALATLIDQHRLLSLVGPGGIGKTRLAQALLALRAPAAADGICWVELASVSDEGALPGALATALGFRPEPGDATTALARLLAPRRMLLALDNAEHLLEPVARLVQLLLGAAPGLRLIVTSQTPLKLAEERVHRLGGLAVPQGALPAQQAQSFGAIALFAERAQAADGRFVLADAQVPAVVDLCRQLDGNALAIELAAARVPLLGLPALLDALPARLSVLTSNRDRNAPRRQQSLRATLQWSHDLLPADAQRLFRRLAVVAGSASLALVQALADDDDDGDPAGSAEPWAVLDTLDELVQRSMVEVQQDEDGRSEPRYRLLASPRALAAERLAACGEGDATRERHARAMQRRLDAAYDAMEAGALGVDAWRRGAEADLDDARAALAWTSARGDDLPTQALTLALASALLRALPPPLHAERQTLADRVERLEQALPADAPAPLRYRAAAALSSALAPVQPQRSREAATRALTAARALPDDDLSRWWRVQALCEAADIVAGEAEAEGAEALLAEAAPLEDPAWPPVRRRCSLRVRAAVAAARGAHAQALRLDRDLLQLSRAAGDPSPMTLINIADGELRLGDARAAVASGQALVAQLQAQRDDNHLVYARLNLAAAFLALDRTTAAAEQLGACWPAAARVGRAGWWCDHAALLAALQGRPKDAARLMAAAESRYHGAGDTRQHNEAVTHRRARALLGWDGGIAPADVDDAQLPGLAFGAPPTGGDAAAG